jgi:hypothetical protein
VLRYSEKCGESMRKSKNQFEGAQLSVSLLSVFHILPFPPDAQGWMVRDAKEER